MSEELAKALADVPVDPGTGCKLLSKAFCDEVGIEADEAGYGQAGQGFCVVSLDDCQAAIEKLGGAKPKRPRRKRAE